jgi:hypothetical protein
MLHLIALVLLHIGCRVAVGVSTSELTACLSPMFEISDLYSILRIVMVPA